MNDIVDNELIKYEWRQYDGNCGFYDKNNNLYVGDNEYISNLSTALLQLMNGGKIGYALISNVAGADEIIKIGLGRDGKNKYYSKKSESGGDISWNPCSTSTKPTENGSESNIPFISLGHELAHAWDDIQGTTNDDKWFPGAKYMEIYATHMENLIGKDNHLPLRTHYEIGIYEYRVGPSILVFQYTDSPALNDSNPSAVSIRARLLPMPHTSSTGYSRNALFDILRPVHVAASVEPVITFVWFRRSRRERLRLVHATNAERVP